MSTAETRKPVVIGGKFKFKGDAGATTKKRKIEPVSTSKVDATVNNAAPVIDTLTDAQKRHRQKQMEKEAEQAKKLSSTSFRDRIETFNERLAKTTEHNDIPRVSAAGNG